MQQFCPQSSKLIKKMDWNWITVGLENIPCTLSQFSSSCHRRRWEVSERETEGQRGRGEERRDKESLLFHLLWRLHHHSPGLLWHQSATGGVHVQVFMSTKNNQKICLLQLYCKIWLVWMLSLYYFSHSSSALSQPGDIPAQSPTDPETSCPDLSASAAPGAEPAEAEDTAPPPGTEVSGTSSANDMLCTSQTLDDEPLTPEVVAPPKAIVTPRSVGERWARTELLILPVFRCICVI